MRPLDRPPAAKPFVVFDLESKDGPGQDAGFTRPFAAGLYDGETYRCFRNDPCVEDLPWERRAWEAGGCVDKLMRALLVDQYRDHVVYAHNLGGFDGLHILPWFQRRDVRKQFSIGIVPVMGKIQMLSAWKHNPRRHRRDWESIERADKKDKQASGTWEFLDSARLLPISLDAMARAFDLPGKVDHDLNLPEDDPRWGAYLEQDCVQLFRSMEVFGQIMDELGGGVGVTGPATSMGLFRQSYQAREIRRFLHWPSCRDPSCQGCFHAWIRRGYVGGRTEVWRQSGKGYYADINSSYPYSMTHPLPEGPARVCGEGRRIEAKYTDPSRWVLFLECTVHVPKETYLPPLPLILDGKLKFPVGVFSGVFDWVELEALRYCGGTILHVERWAAIEAKRSCEEFVSRLYPMRDKKSPHYKSAGLALVVKGMLNAWYGKTATANERQEMVVLKPGDPDVLFKMPGESAAHFARRCSEENPRLLDLPNADRYPVRLKDKWIDQEYIVPQIAAHITALSRRLLFDHATLNVLDVGEKLFYGDTDSILSSVKLESSSRLGDLKLEFDGEELEIEALAPKVYILRKKKPFPGVHSRTEDGKRHCAKGCPGCATVKVVMKGIPEAFRQEPLLQRMVAGETIDYELLEKLGSLARRHFFDSPKMISVKKSMRGEQDKRAWTADGDTRPLRVVHVSDAFARACQAREKRPAAWDELLHVGALAVVHESFRARLEAKAERARKARKRQAKIDRLGPIMLAEGWEP
jgi:hypothetical protein